MRGIFSNLGMFPQHNSVGDEQKKSFMFPSRENEFRIPTPEIERNSDVGFFEEEDFSEFDAQTLGACTIDQTVYDNYNEDICNIQIGDELNPQDVVQYEYIVYNEMKKRECRYPRCSFECLDVTAEERCKYINEIDRIHFKCQLTTNTFYRAVGIIDRCLNLIHISSDEFCIFCYTSLLIASKIEDIEPLHIDVLLTCVSESNITKDYIIRAEIQISNSLCFDFNFPNPLFFLDYYLRIIGQTQEQMFIARYIMEICISSEEFCEIKPSALAATSVSLTLLLTQNCCWTEELMAFSNYNPDTLYESLNNAKKVIAQEITKNFGQEEPFHSFMYLKYGLEAFGKVSKRIVLVQAESGYELSFLG